jgi:hypothetical protein
MRYAPLKGDTDEEDARSGVKSSFKSTPVSNKQTPKAQAHSQKRQQGKCIQPVKEITKFYSEGSDFAD